MRSNENRTNTTGIFSAIRQSGLGKSLGWIKTNAWRYSPMQLYEKYENNRFDRIHGTDTRHDVALSSLQIDSPNKAHGLRYHPTPPYSLRKILRNLQIDFADYTFVDFGSGKGRTLLVASELAFKQVIGIEFSQELSNIATNNIALFKNASARQTASVNCDATEFNLPPDNLVLYFFNPFNAVVLKKVLANISASLNKKPRNVFIVYLYLENEELLNSLSGFRLQHKWQRFHIYSYRPSLIQTG